MNLTSEEIIAIASVFIAACALGLTIWQARQNHRYNKLSVKPHLISRIDYNLTDGVFNYDFNIENCGVGLAIIKTVILYYDGEEISRDDPEKYSSFIKSKLFALNQNQNYRIKWGFLEKGEALSKGKTQCFFQVKNLPAFARKDLMVFLKHIRITINYESIYGDKTFFYDTLNSFLIHDKDASA